MLKTSVTVTAINDLVIGDGIQTDSVKPTAATAYKRGDLLVVGAGNVATHTTTGADWSVICLEDVSAAQADAALAAGVDIPVYTQGEFNVNAVTINGVALTTAQKAAARGRANAATAIELRTPFGA